MMCEEKRMIGSYEVKNSIQIARGEVILAEDRNAGDPYMVCDCVRENPFGAEVYTNSVVSGDYIEMLREYIRRAALRVEFVEAERSLHGLPSETLDAADCIPDGMKEDMSGKVVVIKPENLPPEYCTADFQLALCTGGVGSKVYAQSSAVFCTDLYTGEKCRRERNQIAGVIAPDKMPEWAKAKLAELLAGKVTPSIATDGTFEYGGYHFTPYRKFRKGETDRQAPNDSRPWKKDAQYAMRNMSTDFSLGLSKYEWQKTDYSYESFYAASGGSDCDIFRCAENGKLYAPGENELFRYNEPSRKAK